ncbi:MULTISPECIES: excalibur calcium-binding domain-containing protein [Solibacillus]|uniref:Excalibur calcium-binding domain-containing protein n=1 Tax=Solibacillus merdavium TaxID=2762218 RepID=A0ABR8XJ73_9BACL|nr:excalibur calcium-binding domain-containing protein [Solibacillus merdavium]MBD8031985.1 excalibur calcium-binding domain-containing protein [Solibacillus merdavium]
MKKYILSILLSATLIGSLSISTIEVEASTKGKIKLVEYKNCTDLNAVYKGGVAKAANVKNKGGKTKHQPFVSAELYKLNSKSDRDKDGIACEK